MCTASTRCEHQSFQHLLIVGGSWLQINGTFKINSFFTSSHKRMIWISFWIATKGNFNEYLNVHLTKKVKNINVVWLNKRLLLRCGKMQYYTCSLTGVLYIHVHDRQIIHLRTWTPSQISDHLIQSHSHTTWKKKQQQKTKKLWSPSPSPHPRLLLMSVPRRFVC